MQPATTRHSFIEALMACAAGIEMKSISVKKYLKLDPDQIFDGRNPATGYSESAT
jgi:hypothetical protein